MRFFLGCGLLSFLCSWAPDSRAVAETGSATRAPALKEGDVVSVAADEKVIQIQHPNAEKGLVSIEKDKSYQYELAHRPKKSAASFGINVAPAPNISVTTPSNNQISFSSMYKSDSLVTLVGNYEWVLSRSYGTFGIIFEAGLANRHGNGTLASGEQAQEGYSLFIVPLTAMLRYRFEYTYGQWVVPYVEGGGTYYGFAEIRDDNTYNVAGSEAVGGGGGLMFNITRWDRKGAFQLESEFGVSDLYVTLGARAMAGLKPQLDMSGLNILAGVTVDY